MKRAMIVALAAAPAAAGTTTQSASFDWDLNSGTQIASFDAFDSMGGTRELTGVSFSVAGSASWQVTCLNYNTTALEPGDWSAGGGANHNVIFGDIGSDPERVVSFVEFSGLTGSLGAGSGGPFGAPGDPAVTASYSNTFNVAYAMDASEFDAFIGAPVTTNMIAFTDTYVITGGTISIGTDILTAAGDITLTYEYTLVPAPASAAMLGLAGLGVARRRR